MRKLWAASIILIVPVFIIVYLLSRDLAFHEHNQDAFLAAALPERVFMPQTIPIKTYAIITLVTLGVGVIYWLYKVVNLYNAHYKAHLQVEKEMVRLMEAAKTCRATCKKRRFVSHGGDIWGFSRKYNIPLEDVLEFSGP